MASEPVWPAHQCSAGWSRVAAVQLLSCVRLCDPMHCSTSGFPVHHQLPELAHTHVHRVGDAILPSHLLSSPSPPTFNLSSIRVFSSESVLRIRWPKYWRFRFSISPSNEYSGLISFRFVWFNLLAVQGTRVIENCKLKQDTITPLLERPITGTQTMPNARGVVGQQELLFTAEGNAKRYSFFGRQCGSFF